MLMEFFFHTLIDHKRLTCASSNDWIQWYSCGWSFTVNINYAQCLGSLSTSDHFCRSMRLRKQRNGSILDLLSCCNIQWLLATRYKFKLKLKFILMRPFLLNGQGWDFNTSQSVKTSTLTWQKTSTETKRICGSAKTWPGDMNLRTEKTEAILKTHFSGERQQLKQGQLSQRCQ